jgi:drug/metabolite transporter (DMT)-like permease
MTKNLPLSAWIAFITLCIVWGTTYLGIKIGVEYLPPFFFSSFRHLCAGLIFLTPFLLRGVKMPKQDCINAAIAGICMITGGNAMLSWAEKYISSGFAGILSALAPLFITVLSILVFKGFRITWVIILGMLISIGGISILSKPDARDLQGDYFWLGIGLTTVANISWSVGSVFMKKYPAKLSVYHRTGIQMTSGGLVNLIISFFTEQTPDLTVLPTRFWLAFAYLVLFGSLIGYMSFVYVLEYMPPARASIHVYINTVIAVIVGWLFGGEHLTWLMFGAMLIVLIGVIMVNREYSKMAQKV